MSVFRPAFVELGQAAFEAAKELGRAFEAALVEAAKVPESKPALRASAFSMCQPDVWVAIFKAAQERSDWKLISWQRSASHELVTVHVRLKCGHVGRFVVDELKVVSAVSKTDLLSYLLDKIEEGPEPRCKCGTPQGLGPAGKGSL